MNPIDMSSGFVLGGRMAHRNVSVSDLMLAHESVQILLSFEDYPVKPVSLKPGDHVIEKRFFGLYTHHGLFIGDGNVIHYAPDKETKAKGRVQQSTLATFQKKSRLYVRRYKLQNVDVQRALERSKSRLTETQYSLLTNNCEHFVEWCILGAPRSGQIEDLKLGIIAATSGTGR